MKGRSSRRAPRRRIFLGCEGASEQGYAGFLTHLARQRDLPIHIDAVLLQPGAGDHCALVETAIDRLRENVRRDGPYAHRAILLDADRLGKSPERDARARRLAEEAGLLLVWQTPSHEALVLRHLDGCDALRPPTAAEALRLLRQRWPEYAKALPARRLIERLDEAGMRRAARTEPDLTRLLRLIRLV